MVRYMHPTNDGGGGQGKKENPLEGRKLLEVRPEIARMVDSARRILNKTATPQELLLITAEWIPMARKMNGEEVALCGIECTAALFGKVNTAFEAELRRNPNGLANQLSGARDELWTLLWLMRNWEQEEGRPQINEKEVSDMISNAKTADQLIEIADRMTALRARPTEAECRIALQLMGAIRDMLESGGEGGSRERLELVASRLQNHFDDTLADMSRHP